jgi:cbb3-type cytochrome oxidase maturation protein
MEVIYLLIPLSLVLVAVIVGFVIWAVKNGQFEDLERPGYSILDDDDSIQRHRETAGPGGSRENGPSGDT